MLQYIIRRVALVVPMLFVLSLVSFLIIQAPPGSYFDTYVAILAEQGEILGQEEIDAMRRQYGVGQPVHIQYAKWMWGIFHGNLGVSLDWSASVTSIIKERLALTMVLSLSAITLTWMMAFPIGIYSAVNQYSFWDYTATSVGFLGLSTPDFMVALFIMWIAFAYFGVNLSGLFSQDMISEPWGPAKVWDLMKHLWLPAFVIGTSHTAGLIRVMRNNLLDELNKPYVEAARAKGLSEWKLILKYPVRLALNPFISTVGWTLPGIVSGETIVSIVLSLPTTGPLLVRSLLAQDLFLAASFIMLLSVLTILGTLVSDILLAWQDPRIRMEET